MRDWDARHLAAAAGATLVRRPSGAIGAPGPERASVYSRTLSPGELFVGLRGERADGGGYAAQALAAGAWGVLVAPEHARAVAETAHGGAVLAHSDPLAGLHALARAWRRELRARGAMVVAITGSTGKTSTKDILAALLAGRLRVAASPANFNTEVGLPLALLGAPGETELLVLEMAMRGPGQIAQLTAIAEPDVGVIVNVGPAHLELLGSLEAIAAAKAELIAGLSPGASVVVPAGEPLLAPGDRPAISSALAAAISSSEPSSSRWAGPDVDDRRRPAQRSPSLRNLPRTAHRHLQHEQLRLARCAQQGERQPDLGVEVRRAGRHPQAAGEQGREDVLVRGLARRAGDRDHHCSACRSSRRHARASACRPASGSLWASTAPPCAVWRQRARARAPPARPAPAARACAA